MSVEIVIRNETEDFGFYRQYLIDNIEPQKVLNQICNKEDSSKIFFPGSLYKK